LSEGPSHTSLFNLYFEKKEDKYRYLGTYVNILFITAKFIKVLA
jgi:hypothetical protein